MARLTTFSRLLIVLVIVGGVFFGVRYFLPKMNQSAGGDDRTEMPAGQSSEQTDNGGDYGNNQPGTASSGSNANYTPQPFNFSPPMPNGGKLKGVVELGAQGFNSFIIRIDNRKNWKLEKAEFGTSLVYEGLASEADIRSGLKRFIADMLAYGVGPRDIHFVISSGAKKVPVTQQISTALREMNYYVNEVTAEQEAQLAFRASMPSEFASRAFVVDIGSGNTKISWMQGSRVEGREAPGAKYFQNNMSPDVAYRQTFDLAKQVPSGQRQTCFIIGGVPFELAKQHRQGKERYTVLKAPGAYSSQEAKTVAGLNIYKAIADATGCQQFVFDWDANFTIGFLLNL